MSAPTTDRIANLRHYIAEAYRALIAARAKTANSPNADNIKAEMRAEDTMNRWIDRYLTETR